MVSSILKFIHASNVRALSQRMKIAVKAENESSNNLCISMRYKSTKDQNSNPSEVVLEYIKQTCIHFEQRVEYLDAKNMTELAEKMEKLTKEMNENEGYVCTCMQTQSNFGAYSSFSTAIMIFTKQYP